MSLQIRIFLGYHQNKELKMYLNQSKRWKEAKVSGLLTLKETLWENDEYIGLFISPMSTCALIKEKEQEIKRQLQLYCPKINLDKHASYLFPQLFFL